MAFRSVSVSSEVRLGAPRHLLPVHGMQSFIRQSPPVFPGKGNLRVAS